MTAQELKATTLLSLKIDAASAKVATGMPGDLSGDKSWPVWAGVIPLRQTLGEPVPDPDSPPGLALPVVRFG